MGNFVTAAIYMTGMTPRALHPQLVVVVEAPNSSSVKSTESPPFSLLHHHHHHRFCLRTLVLIPVGFFSFKMGSDAIANVPLSSYAKDSAKKNKGTRLTKLKENKVDVRREQWLCQVKNKGYKVETNEPIRKGIAVQRTPGDLPTRARDEILATFDSEAAVSWTSSPIGRNKFGRNSFGKDSSGSRSSCGGSCTSSSTDEDREDSCLDDWEAIADSLTSDHSDKRSSILEGSKSVKNIHNSSTLKLEGAGTARRAWSPDDAFRPLSLPSLSKQKHNMIKNSGRTWQRVVSKQPSSCPICCEDFDLTDSSFLPCSCGFRLCLFCHKRILEIDGRCPGCRNQYDLSKAVGLGCQMTQNSSKNNSF